MSEPEAKRGAGVVHTTPPMSTRQVLERYIDAYRSGDTSYLAEIVSPDFVDRSFPSLSGGPEGVARSIRVLHTGFSDVSITLQDVVCHEDRAAIRFTVAGTHSGTFAGRPATARRVTWSGADFMRLDGGKIVELWTVQDSLSLLRGIGAV